jgi:hypothetical protein
MFCIGFFLFIVFIRINLKILIHHEDTKFRLPPLKPGQEILVNAVIPERMPVSSAMDGNFPITLPHDLGSYSFTSPSAALRAGV